MIACGSMRCRVTGWKMLICLRVNGDLVENAELSKVNQPQIPQAYQCNLLEKCCYTSGRSWHAKSIPKPKLQQVGQKLKRLFIGQTCSEQNLNCRTLRNSNMPPLAASEAKSLTVGKRQGHRPAFHQNNPNILVKIETDSSMSPVNVLEGNFGLTPPLINWPVLSLESLQVAATALGSLRAPDHAAPAEKAAPSGLKVLRISG